MKYAVNEKKFYKIDDISKILDYEFQFNHLETTFELEKYELEIEVKYESLTNEEKSSKIIMPIEMATSMTEQLTATVQNVDLKYFEKEGVELNLTLDIEVLEFETENKEEIHDSYQAELEVKLQERCECTIDNNEFNDKQEETNALIISTNNESDSSDLFSNLKVGYEKYRVLSLE